MSTQVFIDVSELLFKAYKLGLNSEEGSDEYTKAQIRNIILGEVPVLTGSGRSEPESAPVSAKGKSKSKSADGEKKPRAAPKPRAVPEDDTRCCARSFYESEHLDGGKLKTMRDDADNLYGDRCKFKKSGGDFCKHHTEKQPHGVWNGEYSGKFKPLLEALASSGEESKPAAPKKLLVKKPAPAPVVAPKAAAKTAPVPKSADSVEYDDDEEVHSDDEFYEESKLEKEGLDCEVIEIDDMDYLIDAQGNVYDPEDEKKVGKYDIDKKKWISGPK